MEETSDESPHLHRPPAAGGAVCLPEVRFECVHRPCGSSRSSCMIARAARRPLHHRPATPRAEPARIQHLGVDLRRPRAALRPRRLVHVRCDVRRRVLCRLADRVQPLGRQPLRLRDHHDAVRRTPEAPAGSPADRHHPRPDHARRVHRRRRRADLAVRLGLLHLRRVPDLHRDQLRAAGRARRGGLQGEHADPVEPPGAAGLPATSTAPRSPRATTPASGCSPRCWS